MGRLRGPSSDCIADPKQKSLFTLSSRIYRSLLARSRNGFDTLNIRRVALFAAPSFVQKTSTVFDRAASALTAPCSGFPCPRQMTLARLALTRNPPIPKKPALLIRESAPVLPRLNRVYRRDLGMMFSAKALRYGRSIRDVVIFGSR